jgi:hypothetical protein
MAKKRALKDAAKDPVAKKESPAAKIPEKQTPSNASALKILGAALLGIAIGIVGGQFIRLRL